VGFGDDEFASVVHRQQGDSNFEECIGVTVEASCFNVNDDGQEASESIFHE
jgi:hypothetical protein